MSFSAPESPSPVPAVVLMIDGAFPDNFFMNRPANANSFMIVSAVSHLLSVNDGTN